MISLGSIVCFGVVFLSMSLGITAYSIGGLCTSDSDCPDTTTTYCYKLQYNPPCQKGQCQCRSGYVYDGSSACKATVSLSPGSSCNSSFNEVYPYQAFCNSTVVTCRGPNYVTSGSTCQPVTMASYNSACQQTPSSLSQTCNSTAGMICSPSSLCICQLPNKFYSSGNATCQFRGFGDPCSQTSDCDTALYTNYQGAQGGPSCNSGYCGCASGFSQVARLSQNMQTLVISTIQMCLAGSTSNLALNATCTLVPEAQSNSGAQVCSTSYICARCPEDTTAATTGLCRQYLGGGGMQKAADVLSLTCAIFVGLLAKFF